MYKCLKCEKDLSKEGRPELIEICYECCIKDKKLVSYKYISNLNFVPKPKIKEIEISTTQ